MMHLTEDYRTKKDDDDDKKDENGEERIEVQHTVHFPFEPVTEDVSTDDSEALRLRGKNALAEEESIEEDDVGGD